MRWVSQLLRITFKNQESDVLAGKNILQINENNKDIILQRRKEFESNLDIEYENM